VAALRNDESDLAAGFAERSAGPTLVAGDFNLAGDSGIFERDWGDWDDAFATGGFGLGYTFISGPIGLRIDHLLADKRHWRTRSCHVGPDLNGEHRPLVADLLLLE
jgi:hypothetical protein